jgi:hypothetical protein
MKSKLYQLIEERRYIDDELKWESKNLKIIIENDTFIISTKEPCPAKIEIKGKELTDFYEWFGKLLCKELEESEAVVTEALETAQRTK